MHKKAQAGIGIMGTYGWSALMIMTVMSTMGYFASENIDQFVPNICMLEPGIVCTDHLVDSLNNGIAIQITYSLPKTIVLTGLEFSDDEGIINNCKATLNNPIGGGQSRTFIIGKVQNKQGIGTCTVKDEHEGKIKANIKLKYRNEGSDFDHIVHGRMVTNIE